jgi:hypothetical protein
MYFETLIRKDYFTAAAEIIVTKKGYVEFAPDLYLVSEKFFLEFSSLQMNLKIIDSLVLYHKNYLLIKIIHYN